MIDSVEAFRDRDRPRHCSRRRCNVATEPLPDGRERPGRKPSAVLGKTSGPTALAENLQHSLLDQSVDDAEHAELSDPAVRLRDFDPLDRLRLIGSLKQLSPNVWPVLTQVILWRRVGEGHSIDARTALDGFERASTLLSRFSRSHSSSIDRSARGRTFGSLASSHQRFSVLGFGVQGLPPRPSAAKVWRQLFVQSTLPRSARGSSVLQCRHSQSFGAFSPRSQLGLSVSPPFGFGYLTSLADCLA